MGIEDQTFSLVSGRQVPHHRAAHPEAAPILSVTVSLLNSAWTEASSFLTGGILGSVSGCLAGDVFLAIMLRRGKNRTQSSMRSRCEEGVPFSL